MNNPISLRLGVTKNWSNESKDLNLVQGYFKALNSHTSEIYLQTHTNNVYLYLYMSHDRYYYKNTMFDRYPISLYKNYIKFFKNDFLKNQNNNRKVVYTYKSPKIQSFYILYYIKLLKLLLNNNNYNIHVIKLKRISRNTNIYLSYLTKYISLNARVKQNFVKKFYKQYPAISFPYTWIYTLPIKKKNIKLNKNINFNKKFKFNKGLKKKENLNFNKIKRFKIEKFLKLDNLKLSKNYLHNHYLDIVKDIKIDNKKLKIIQNYLKKNNLSFIKDSKLRNKNLNTFINNKKISIKLFKKNFDKNLRLKNFLILNWFKLKKLKRSIWVPPYKFRKRKRRKKAYQKKLWRYVRRIFKLGKIKKKTRFNRIKTLDMIKKKNFFKWAMNYGLVEDTEKGHNFDETRKIIRKEATNIINFINTFIKIHIKTEKKNETVLFNTELNNNVIKDLLININKENNINNNKNNINKFNNNINKFNNNKNKFNNNMNIKKINIKK